MKKQSEFKAAKGMSPQAKPRIPDRHYEKLAILRQEAEGWHGYLSYRPGVGFYLSNSPEHAVCGIDEFRRGIFVPTK